MNSLLRNALAAVIILSFVGIGHAGLANLLGKAMGKTGQVHIILIDDTGSITDADRGIYREATGADLKSAKAGDRVVVARISDAKLGGFRAEMDVSIADTGKHYDDLATGKLVHEKAQSTIAALLKPVKGSMETRILDVISALEPLITEARTNKQRIRLLMLTDGIEETQEANMAKSTVDDTWINRVIAARQRAKLIPKLVDVETFMIGGGGSSAAQAKAIEAFWRRYLSITGAQLKFYGRTVPKFEQP